MTNLTSCFKANEERRKNARGTSQQLLPFHTGRTNQEQCWQWAQLTFKCVLCLLIIAPPLLAQVPSPSDSARTDTALPDSPRPDLNLLVLHPKQQP